MKKFLVCLIVGIFVLPCNGAIQVKLAGGSDDGLDYLRNEIKKLENELNSKTEKLNKCAEKNKNFQIAGIATVGLAGVGVATNISLYSKMKDQKKLAENMNNKIRTANAEMDRFMSDMEKWSQNLDYDKFLQELDTQLTETEKQRVVELYNNDFDLEKVYNGNTDNIPESDKILFEKVIRAMRKCQK